MNSEQTKHFKGIFLTWNKTSFLKKITANIIPKGEMLMILFQVRNETRMLTVTVSTEIYT